MLWLWLVLIAAFLLAIVNIMDKHIVSDELRDPTICMTIYGITYFFLSSALIIISKSSIVFDSNLLFAMIAGIIVGLGGMLYYKALKHEDVSRVIPLFLITPLFVLLMGIIFLNETFTLTKYLGIFLLVAGAGIISFKKKKDKKTFKIRKVVPIIILASLFYASRDIIVRSLSDKLEFFPLLFGVSGGVFIVSLILFLFHHPHILKKTREIAGAKHLFMLSILGTIGNFLFFKAVTLQKVALVSALVNTKVFLVFILAILLSMYDPKIIREHLERTSIAKKAFGTILLFAGAVLIIL